MYDLTPDPAAQPLPTQLPLVGADPKPWWASQTIIASGVVVMSQLAALIGYQVDAPQLLDVVTSVVAAAGGLWAIWGRVRAAQPIAPVRRA